MDQRLALARADLLAKSSSAALRRLNRRVESLEQDVLPVHKQTKALHTAHKNIAIAAADLSEACGKLRAVVALQEVLENAEQLRDWEKLSSCLEEFNAAHSYIMAHPALSQQRDLIATVGEVRQFAIACLQRQYVQATESIPSDAAAAAPGSSSPEAGPSKQTRWDSRMETVCADLIRMREAMVMAGYDGAPGLLQELRTEAVTSALLRGQRMVDAKENQASEVRTWSNRHYISPPKQCY
jgi:hypothetical protein